MTLTCVWSFALCALTITGTVAYLGPHVDLRSQQNLAQAKPTEQSSTEWTYSKKPRGGGVSRTKAGNSSQAVDGNLQTNWENATCTYTTRDDASWWMVDLQALYLVERIAIFLPPIYVLLKNFTISTAWYLNETSDDRRLIRPSLCYQNYTNDYFPVGRNDFTCYSARVARYVRVDKSLRNPSRLSLCQVEVYGSITLEVTEDDGVTFEEEFRSYDVDGDEYLDREEALVWVLSGNQGAARDKAEHLFRETDSDNDGVLTAEEIDNQHDLWLGSLDDYSPHMSDEL